MGRGNYDPWGGELLGNEMEGNLRDVQNRVGEVN